MSNEIIFTITDLKQFIYCPRIFYYHACLPSIRPVTYKMERGIQAHESERVKAARRSLDMYDLPLGERHFDVPVYSPRLGLSGQIDEVIATENSLIPVDYKLARQAGDHFKVQLAAYAMMLEDLHAVHVSHGFLYLIAKRKAEKITISAKLRDQVNTALVQMRHIAEKESMPAATIWRQRCADCEFRRFCNDV